MCQILNISMKVKTIWARRRLMPWFRANTTAWFRANTTHVEAQQSVQCVSAGHWCTSFREATSNFANPEGSSNFANPEKSQFCQSGGVLILPIRTGLILQTRSGPIFANPEGSQFCQSGGVLFLSIPRGPILPIRRAPIFANPEGSYFCQSGGVLFCQDLRRQQKRSS